MRELSCQNTRASHLLLLFGHLSPSPSPLFQRVSWPLNPSPSKFDVVKMEALNYAQLQEELKKPGTILIDVRDPDELTKDGKIEQSKNLPLGGLNGGLKLSDADFKAKYGFDKPSKDQRIICHCKSGMRAEVGAGEFKSAGFKNVGFYPGIQDWKKNGGPVVK